MPGGFKETLEGSGCVQSTSRSGWSGMGACDSANVCERAGLLRLVCDPAAFRGP